MGTPIRLLFLAGFLIGSAALGNSEAVLDAVASGFQFPKDRLRIRDLSNFEDAKKDPRIKAGYVIESDDNTFAHVQFLVTEPGTILTRDIEERFRNAIAEQSKSVRVKPNVRRLQYGNGGDGYVGVLGLGPGGSTTAAVITVPGKYDLRMTVFENFEDPLGASAETAAYYKAMMENDDFLKDALGRASQTIANEIVAGRLQFGEDQAALIAASPLASGPRSFPPAAATSSPPPPVPAQSVEQTPPPALAASRSTPWLWWLSLAVALSLGIVWLIRARK